jgi:hypothetical protein
MAVDLKKLTKCTDRRMRKRKIIGHKCPVWTYVMCGLLELSNQSNKMLIEQINITVCLRSLNCNRKVHSPTSEWITCLHISFMSFSPFKLLLKTFGRCFLLRSVALTIHTAIYHPQFSWFSSVSELERKVCTPKQAIIAAFQILTCLPSMILVSFDVTHKHWI